MDNHDLHQYRTPVELGKSIKPVKRFLAVGSCFLAGFPALVSALEDGAEADYIIFNNAADLPENPPKALSEYDFQIVQIPMRSILPDLNHARLRLDKYEDFENLFEECLDRLKYLLKKATKYSEENYFLTFITNFIEPQQSTTGRNIKQSDLRNITFFIKKLNEKLAEIIVDKKISLLLM